MKRQLWGLMLLAAALGLAQPVWGDDGFYVIAGGRGVGTAITSVPKIISTPGFYYLGGNLTSSGGVTAITIAANEVTLDLMGFSITGPGSSSGTGIFVNAVTNVEVRNGMVTKFNNGILAAGTNQRLVNLKVSSCTEGIVTNAVYGQIISNCQLCNNYDGIIANCSPVIIDKNTAYNNSNVGIGSLVPGIITNNVAYGNGKGFYLSGNSRQLVDRNSSYNNTTNWQGLPGCTVGINTP